MVVQVWKESQISKELTSSQRDAEGGESSGFPMRLVAEHNVGPWSSQQPRVRGMSEAESRLSMVPPPSERMAGHPPL